MVELLWKDEPADLPEAALADWVGVETDQEHLLIAGRCPRCHHDASATISPSAVVRAVAAEDGSGRFDAATLFACNCDAAHRERPSIRANGCGAFWVGKPRRVASSGEYLVDPVKQADLVAAAKLVYQEAEQTRTGIRTLAEKWIPGVAAVTGALGVATVVVADDASAGLDQQWRVATFALIALAVLAAALATILVYRAAYGWPETVPLHNDDDVREAARRITDRTSSVAATVRTSLWWSVVSLLALVAALGVIWLQPEPDRPLRVTYAEGGLVDAPTVLCGKMLGVGGEALRLAVTDGGRTTTELVPVAAILDLEQVSACTEGG